MSNDEGKIVVNVRRQYRQLLLSGYEHPAQSTNEKRDHKTLPKLTTEPPKLRKGERAYNLSIQVVIEQVSNDSGEYIYRVLLNDDPNLSVTPYSVRGKKETGPAVDLPKKGNKGGDSFSMVYGIHKGGQRALSHTPQHPLQRVLPQIYSFILGAIDRAIECTILIPEEAPRIDDPGQRIESTPTQKSLGADKKKRRGKALRPQVLPETLPEEAAILVADDGQVLGWEQRNPSHRLIDLGSGTDNGGAIANALSDGQTPDIGF